MQDLIHRVRKCRMMGSAALDLAYVASGRLDAYIEAGVRIWDVAAGSAVGRQRGRQGGDDAASRRAGENYGGCLEWPHCRNR